jgi:hypothetical protein
MSWSEPAAVPLMLATSLAPEKSLSGHKMRAPIRQPFLRFAAASHMDCISVVVTFRWL